MSYYERIWCHECGTWIDAIDWDNEEDRCKWCGWEVEAEAEAGQE